MRFDKVRILLIDDQVLCRVALAELLGGLPDMEVVGQVGTISEAIIFLSQEMPDVILLEYDLTGELASKFFSKLPGIGTRSTVMVFSSGMSAAAMGRLYRAGAAGVLWKSMTPGELIRDMRRALCEPSAFRQRPPDSQPRPRNLKTLTSKQVYVARAVLESKPSKIIAAEMGVTESTVKSTLQKLFKKTGTTCRTELVRLLIERADLDYLGDSKVPTEQPSELTPDEAVGHQINEPTSVPGLFTCP